MEALVELPEWHIECKGTKSALVNLSTLALWYEQLERDCPKNLKAVLLHKPNNHSIMAYLPFSVWERISAGKQIAFKNCVGESLNAEEELKKFYGLNWLKVKTSQEHWPTSPLQVLYFAVTLLGVFAILSAQDWLALIRPS